MSMTRIADLFCRGAGVPAGLPFCRNKGDQVKQIGNAVPPGFARNLTAAALGTT